MVDWIIPRYLYTTVPLEELSSGCHLTSPLLGLCPAGWLSSDPSGHSEMHDVTMSALRKQGNVVFVRPLVASRHPGCPSSNVLPRMSNGDAEVGAHFDEERNGEHLRI